jgi:hypothetical protein
VKRLIGLRGPVYVVPGEVAEVTRHRRNWARVFLKGGHRLLVRGAEEVVRALLADSSDEASPRASPLRLVEEGSGPRRLRNVALEELAALDHAPERDWSLAVLKGGETVRVSGDPAQIVRTGASPQAVLKALGTVRESERAAAPAPA